MLKFSYRLTGHGWATACVSNGSETLILSLSYISPALDDLVEATIALLLGAERSDFWWHSEPGRYQVLLVRHGEVVRLSVEEGNVEIFAAEDLLLGLAVQVRSQLRQLHRKHGLEGYQASWRRPFPLEGQKRLESLIKAGKAG